MGFITTSLSRFDTNMITSLEPNIIHTMKCAAGQLLQNTFYSQVWFGDARSQWIANLSRKLTLMVDIIERYPINIFYIPEPEIYQTHYAKADRPRFGWRDLSQDQNGTSGDLDRYLQGEVFQISLGAGWFSVPKYRNYFSKESRFMLLVHELSHILLNTRDYVRDYNPCKELALQDDRVAKRNADNWAYFLEEFKQAADYMPHV